MVWDHDAVGSNPIISTIKKTYSFEWVIFISMGEMMIRPTFATCRKLGSPSKQSREVLAHLRLRSVTSNLLRSHPIISTIKSTVPFGTVLFILFEMMIRPTFATCCKLGSPSE